MNKREGTVPDLRQSLRQVGGGIHITILMQGDVAWQLQLLQHLATMHVVRVTLQVQDQNPVQHIHCHLSNHACMDFNTTLLQIIH